MIFNMTGGGAPLNFKVAGGTTQPANPTENMIWVNTSTTITDWIFSATEPSAVSGRVWVSTDTSSSVEFNALKKNGIQVYPISAKQYVSGAWVDKTAKSYRNGEWTDWAVYLINGADTCESITGGWTARNHLDIYANDGTADFGANGITLRTTYDADISVMTNNKVDLSGRDEITVIVSNGVITWPEGFRMYFSDTPLQNYNESSGNYAAYFHLVEGENVIKIPDGIKNGKFYVSIGIFAYDHGDQNVTIQAVFMM